VRDGVVYEASGRPDHNLYAIGASSGKEFLGGSAEGLLSSPAVADGVAYIGAFDGGVNAYDAVTGARSGFTSHRARSIQKTYAYALP
jgi:outer membrane protein assembly factor BamB